MPRTPDALDVFLWNPWTGNPWPRVRDTLTDEVERNRPDLIVLNEVRRHYDHLDGWAERHGYVCHQEKPRPEVPGKPVPEHGSTAVLVDARLGILSAKPVAMREPWKVFSHDRTHRPRRGWQIRLRSDGGQWKGRFVHGPTNGFDGGNRVAFAEFARLAAAALTNKATRTTSFAVSDHNERVGRLRKWARAFGGKVAGHNVDSCIVVGGTVTAEVLGKHGSDHHAVRFRITRK